MTSENPAPPTSPLPGEIRARERRSYALNLCRHCGCFAHLTVRSAAKKNCFGRSARLASVAWSVEPHPLGDLAGRIAHARRLEADPIVALREPMTAIHLAAPPAARLGRLSVKITQTL